MSAGAIGEADFRFAARLQRQLREQLPEPGGRIALLEALLSLERVDTAPQLPAPPFAHPPAACLAAFPRLMLRG